MRNLSQKLTTLALTLTFTSQVFANTNAKNVASTKSIEIANTGSLYYSENFLSSQFASWGIDPASESASIKLKKSWSIFKKNKDVVVAIVDTGIQYNHPFLQNNIYVTGGNPSEKNYGVDFSGKKESLDPSDTHGHGTHVAGIVKSIFPEVKLLALKYYNPQASGQANLDATIKALRYAVEKNVDIINYSGGGPEPSREELEILREAERKGILVIAAAGNEKSNIDDKKNAYYPASYGLSNIITVAAHDQTNSIISSSNWGQKTVDIAAPGYRIKSAIPGSGAGHMTGTSQATAFVSGVAALVKSQHPNLNFQQIRNIIISSSEKLPTLKNKILDGGKLNAENALVLAKHVNEKLYGAGRSVAKKEEIRTIQHFR